MCVHVSESTMELSHDTLAVCVEGIAEINPVFLRLGSKA